MADKGQPPQLSEQDAQNAKDPNHPAHPNHPHVSPCLEPEYCRKRAYWLWQAWRVAKECGKEVWQCSNLWSWSNCWLGCNQSRIGAVGRLWLLYHSGIMEWSIASDSLGYVFHHRYWNITAMMSPTYFDAQNPAHSSTTIPHVSLKFRTMWCTCSKDPA